MNTPRTLAEIAEQVFEEENKKYPVRGEVRLALVKAAEIALREHGLGVVKAPDKGPREIMVPAESLLPGDLVMVAGKLQTVVGTYLGVEKVRVRFEMNEYNYPTGLTVKALRR